MFDAVPSTISEKEMKRARKDELRSRIHSYTYAAEDYDRSFGKGKFFKKFPNTKTIIDTLQKEYINELNKETIEALK